MAGVVKLADSDSFSQFLQDAGSQLHVVHFWADWAAQCQQVTTVLSQLADDQANAVVKFAQVEAEKLPEVSQKYGISAVPTCLLIKNQEVIDRVNGVNVPELTSKIQNCAASSDTMGASGTKSATAENTKEDLNSRLKKLINAAPVMLFMKGNPQEPRCGFSRQVVALLAEQKVTYSSFNILADDEVRQGLKEYSDWPTFPQLYAKGELVGGLDIIKELIESGEFLSQLPSKESLEDRLKGLINKDRVMLFMKGDPTAPKCGFSKTIVGILKDTGVSYSHFDILTDDEVRQGLKKYSNWPTYPQLYVSGELIGGVDIIKELLENDELVSTLTG